MDRHFLSQLGRQNSTSLAYVKIFPGEHTDQEPVEDPWLQNLTRDKIIDHSRNTYGKVGTTLSDRSIEHVFYTKYHLRTKERFPIPQSQWSMGLFLGPQSPSSCEGAVFCETYTKTWSNNLLIRVGHTEITLFWEPSNVDHRRPETDYMQKGNN